MRQDVANAQGKVGTHSKASVGYNITISWISGTRCRGEWAEWWHTFLSMLPRFRLWLRISHAALILCVSLIGLLCFLGEYPITIYHTCIRHSGQYSLLNVFTEVELLVARTYGITISRVGPGLTQGSCGTGAAGGRIDILTRQTASPPRAERGRLQRERVQFVEGYVKSVRAISARRLRVRFCKRGGTMLGVGGSNIGKAGCQVGRYGDEDYMSNNNSMYLARIDKR